MIHNPVVSAHGGSSELVTINILSVPVTEFDTTFDIYYYDGSYKAEDYNLYFGDKGDFTIRVAKNSIFCLKIYSYPFSASSFMPGATAGGVNSVFSIYDGEYDNNWYYAFYASSDGRVSFD